MFSRVSPATHRSIPHDDDDTNCTRIEGILFVSGCKGEDPQDEEDHSDALFSRKPQSIAVSVADRLYPGQPMGLSASRSVRG